jgi:cytochrome c oxidase subunit IV
MSLPVAMLVAGVKTTLVAVFFMHFLHERGMSRLSIALALILVASLALLAVADVATRFPLSVMRDASAPRSPLPEFPPGADQVTPF